MKIALINASPRGKTSTSAVLLEKTKAYIGGTNEFFDIQANKENLEPAQLETLKQAEIWVFANPLYIDSLPGHLLAVLEQLEAECRESHKVYVIINCGFFEADQNKTALCVYKNWCRKCGYEWCGAAAIGGGGGIGFMPPGIPFNAGPLKPVNDAIVKLSACISGGAKTEDILASIGMPRLLYLLGGHMGWKKAAKANGLKVKDLYRNPL